MSANFQVGQRVYLIFMGGYVPVVVAGVEYAMVPGNFRYTVVPMVGDPFKCYEVFLCGHIPPGYLGGNDSVGDTEDTTTTQAP